MNGVYIIENIINNKCYIGSSINIHKRLTDHRSLLIRNAHHSYKLQGSVNKHGIDKFDFRVIEYAYFPEEYSKEAKLEYLECLEGYYINKFNSYKKGYNVSKIPKIVGNTNTKESIIKGVKTRRERGSYIISETTRQRRSDSLRNNKKLKIKLKENAQKRVKPVYQYDLDGNFIKEWRCISDISSELNIYKSIIHKNIKGIYGRCKDFIFTHKKYEKLTPYKDIVDNRPKKACRCIEVYDSNDTLLNIYSSYKECAIDLKLKPNTISSYLSRGVTCRGYKLKYG